MQFNELLFAARNLAKNHQFLDASLLGRTRQVSSLQASHHLTEQDRTTGLIAAYFFQKVGQYDTAAELLKHLDDVGHARRLYQLCWERYSDCTPQSQDYKEACQMLIAIASVIDDFPPELTTFLGSFLKGVPKRKSDANAFYEVGLYYFRKKLFDHARTIFGQILRGFGSYKETKRLMSGMRRGSKGTASVRASTLQKKRSNPQKIVRGSVSQAYSKNAASKKSGQNKSKGLKGYSSRSFVRSGLISTSSSRMGLEAAKATGYSSAQEGSSSRVKGCSPTKSSAERPLSAGRRAAPVSGSSSEDPASLPRATMDSDETMESYYVELEDEPTLIQKRPNWSELLLKGDSKKPSRSSGQPTHSSNSIPSMPEVFEPSDGSDTFISVNTFAEESKFQSNGIGSLEMIDPGHFLTLEDLRPGTMIGGRYQVSNVLGEGGMATVYSAVDVELDEVVALKMFDGASDSEDGLLRLKKELKLSRRLSHPNIIRLHDIGAHKCFHYLSMEMLEGVDLEQYLEKRGAVKIDEGLDILRQVCLGLQAVHEKGVIHRDLKPSNLFLTDEGVIKLMDFGIATHHNSSRMTAEGVVLGTAAYMAPERVTGRRDASVLGDMYALGVIAFELFTGELPFFHEKVMKLFLMHVNTPVPEPRELNPNIPISLSKIIKTLMSKAPERRIPTCAALSMALEKVPVR